MNGRTIKLVEDIWYHDNVQLSKFNFHIYLKVNDHISWTTWHWKAVSNESYDMTLSNTENINKSHFIFVDVTILWDLSSQVQQNAYKITTEVKFHQYLFNRRRPKFEKSVVQPIYKKGNFYKKIKGEGRGVGEADLQLKLG